MTQEKEIWVYCEQNFSSLAKVSFELLGKASELCDKLGATLVSIVVGDGVEELARRFAAYSDKVYLVDDARLKYYQNRAYAKALGDLIGKFKPEIFLMGATEIGEDLAPCIAAKVGTGLTAHCIDLKIQEYEGIELLYQTVSGWRGGKKLDIVCPKQRPQMATVKPGVFNLPASTQHRKGDIIEISPQLDDSLFRAKTIEIKLEEINEAPIEEAEVVIAAGWGCNSLDSFDQVNDLAEALCGTIAGTRPMLDKGYITINRMIGQSGKLVYPRIFISLGASGAMHFTSGFERAKFVLAIDKNPQAPIFQVADIGIIGDLRDLLPALIEELSHN